MKTNKKMFLFCLGLAILVTSCDLTGGTTEPAWDGYFYVKYAVQGTAETVDITIENESGGVSQFSDVPLPWEYEFSAYAGTGSYDYLFVYVSAQNQGYSGSVTSKIYSKKYEEDEYEEFKSSTSEGAFVIATASGSLD